MGLGWVSGSPPAPWSVAVRFLPRRAVPPPAAGLSPATNAAAMATLTRRSAQVLESRDSDGSDWPGRQAPLEGDVSAFLAAKNDFVSYPEAGHCIVPVTPESLL